MRKKLLKILKCPNNHNSDLKIFGAEVNRNGQILFNIENDQLLDDDDIINGVIISEKATQHFQLVKTLQFCYPIMILILIIIVLYWKNIH